jgi:small subunit ribosomal protein S16
VAVKIKLKRMGKIRAPFYRIIVADARTKRDGRAIEEIGKYHPKAEPSFIEVNSERAQHWLSVGAQPTDPVRRILEITGDWQKFKGLPGAEGTLKTAAAKADKKEAFAAAVAETVKAAEAKADKGKTRKPAAAADTAKTKDAAKDTRASSGKAGGRDGKRTGTGRSGKGAQADAGSAEDGAAKDSAATDSAAADAAATDTAATDTTATDTAATESAATDAAATESAAEGSTAGDGAAEDAVAAGNERDGEA